MSLLALEFIENGIQHFTIPEDVDIPESFHITTMCSLLHNNIWWIL